MTNITNINPKIISLKRNIKKDINISNKIYSELLQPEDRVIRKNILIWVDEINLMLENYLTENNLIDNVDKFVICLNLASLIFCSTGNIEKARSLCYLQIDLFVTLSKSNHHYLKYVFQPWINLGRIDRIIGDYDLALSKFEKLTLIDRMYKFIQIGGHIIENKILLEAIESDVNIQNVIHTCSLTERIKTHLAAKQYKKIIDDLTISRFRNNSLAGYVYEANIIAETKQNNLYKAQKIVFDALNNTPKHLMHIFLLRYAEISQENNESNREMLFQKLCELIEYYETHAHDINHVFFSVKTAGQFAKYGYHHLSEHAYKKSFKMANKMQDEILMIESLKGLSENEKLSELLNKSSYSNLQVKYSNYITIDDNLIELTIFSKLDKLFKNILQINSLLLRGV